MMSLLHTDREYEADLAQLRDLLLMLGARAETQLQKSLHALSNHDPSLAQEIISGDTELDRLEIEADAACMRLLAKRQPVARDLRFVMTTLKVVTDLERIGDLACDVAQRVIEGISLRDQATSRKAAALGQGVVTMLRDAIDALVDVDANRASQVIEADQKIDAACDELAHDIAAAISSRPSEVEPLLRLITLARSLERAADHCTNVAEMVVFLSKGHHIRHLRRIGTPPE